VTLTAPRQSPRWPTPTLSNAADETSAAGSRFSATERPRELCPRVAAVIRRLVAYVLERADPRTVPRHGLAQGRLDRAAFESVTSHAYGQPSGGGSTATLGHQPEQSLVGHGYHRRLVQRRPPCSAMSSVTCFFSRVRPEQLGSDSPDSSMAMIVGPAPCAVVTRCRHGYRQPAMNTAAAASGSAHILLSGGSPFCRARTSTPMMTSGPAGSVMVPWRGKRDVCHDGPVRPAYLAVAAGLYKEYRCVASAGRPAVWAASFGPAPASLAFTLGLASSAGVGIRCPRRSPRSPAARAPMTPRESFDPFSRGAARGQYS